MSIGDGKSPFPSLDLYHRQNINPSNIPASNNSQNGLRILTDIIMNKFLLKQCGRCTHTEFCNKKGISDILDGRLVPVRPLRRE